MTIYKSTLKLLRLPFSINLLPIFLFAVYSAIGGLIPWKTALVFFVIHFIFYPASNAYNSYMDRDSGSIAGLKTPPKPTRQLFQVSVFLDIAGILLSLLVGWQFTLINILLVALSRAYSWRKIRIKKYAVPGFLMVSLAQGGMSYYNMYMGIQGLNYFPAMEGDLAIGFIICSLFVGTIYPITQIYQHADDRSDGIRSMSMLLGIKGTFIFSGVLFIVANGLLYKILEFNEFLIFIGFMILPAVYFMYWMIISWQQPEYADFRRTMIMALGASIAMILGFAIILISLFSS
ncbi:UbiA family prenyltransferase [Portibacter marinus]|uniref:UbiA family prenyltransferase n=1 Tax=Portibacter marinus TaxID=2898660 RepID=UPI001F3ECBDF|nr:UbiA family prenyltransferase [Portibacter marinus]